MFSLRFIVGFIILFLGFHLVATINNLYWLIWWLDIPMHLLAGFWLGLVFVYLNQKFFKIQNKWAVIIFIVSFAVFVGFLYEFFEFIFNISQMGTADTMGDLFFDFLGGLATAIFYAIL